MAHLLGYNNLPQNIKAQIGKVSKIWQQQLGLNLAGIYLHGSIALNAFCPDSGDIDILVVVKDSLSIPKKLEIAKEIIQIDKSPCPLEMSAIKLSDAQNWKNDGNCVFHYSDFWTERYLQRLKDNTSEVYIVDNEFPDADVTSYIKLIKQSGIVLYGQEINETFCDISDEDFWKAISAEVDDYDFNAYEPRYFASNILILGRILSFKIEKRILSKYKAGLWMIDNVPPNLKYIPQNAMKIWFEGEECDFNKLELEELRNYLIQKIKE